MFFEITFDEFRAEASECFLLEDEFEKLEDVMDDEDVEDEDLDDSDFDDSDYDDDEDKEFVAVEYICEECDYRWSAMQVVDNDDDFEDNDDILLDEVTCPMCGSTDVIQK